MRYAGLDILPYYQVLFCVDCSTLISISLLLAKNVQAEEFIIKFFQSNTAVEWFELTTIAAVAAIQRGIDLIYSTKLPKAQTFT